MIAQMDIVLWNQEKKIWNTLYDVRLYLSNCYMRKEKDWTEVYSAENKKETMEALWRSVRRVERAWNYFFKDVKCHFEPNTKKNDPDTKLMFYYFAVSLPRDSYKNG